ITCCTVSDAWNYLFNQNFDIILIEAHMPNNHTTFDFVGQITSLFKLPVIVMSLDHSVSSVMKSIAKGACAYWSKPLDENQFKNMWQHVVRNTLSQSQPHVVRKALSESHELPHTQTLEVKGHKKRGREVVDVPKQPLAKKNRLSWTPDLHEQFLLAVNQLGVNNAVPKEILKRMNCPGLTSGHVSSHLQKYRKYLNGDINKSKLSRGYDFHGHGEICKQQQNWTEIDDSDIFIDLSDLLS
ncbi:two-component response regulator ARR2-like, partial [Trifolium medium]|nr:two-component response regulator ARR2-like [Trifolium medium]